MFEKALITTLKSSSAVIYVITMVALFSFPISFIIHAFLPPVFNLTGIETYADKDNASGTEKDGEYRIDFHIEASSGKFSPYEYTIEEITLQDDSFLDFADSFKVILDEPSHFTKDEPDEMTVSLYIYTDEEFDINAVCSEAQFKTKVYEKGFGEFKVKYGSDT